MNLYFKLHLYKKRNDINDYAVQVEWTKCLNVIPNFEQRILPNAQSIDNKDDSPITATHDNDIHRNILHTIELFDAIGIIEKRLRQSIEDRKKSLDEVVEDLLIWLWQYNSFELAISRFWGSVEMIIDNYFDSLCERSECTIDDYMCEVEMHRILWEDMRVKHKSTIKMLNSKKTFSLWCQKHSLQSTSQIGIIKSSTSNRTFVTLPDGEETSLYEVIKKYGGVFCKPFLDTWGRGAVRIEYRESEGNYLVNGSVCSALPEVSSELVVEQIVQNHADLACLHLPSLNTLRINTIRKHDGTIDILWSCLRMGTKGRPVDNLFGGGVMIKVNTKTGQLDKMDTYKNTSHPDTLIIYESVTIPYWEEVLNLARAAHMAAGDFLSIGWDIAVTPNGPVLIEANIFFGIGPQQTFVGGIRKLFENNKPNL